MIVPPLSVVRVRLVSPEMEGLRVGDMFRIGYYRPMDGMDCVWLVNAKGEYEQTWDQESLFDTFEIIELSEETDLYGINRPEIEAIA